ncbi:hypothetical protein M9H77_31016 [Catharanthus roseus]|uniref:Uncharacterized protein n=1 Tax=Catharanthus roseus TaxID=4058 RepID=A0ACB9ZZ90_CATRO|nr:hypothetical protein M9H77_31016 [Catharanthus roseus]
MEKALKNKLERFEEQGKASRLLSICSISKDQSREQIGEFLSFDSIDPMSSSLCSWGFEALGAIKEIIWGENCVSPCKKPPYHCRVAPTVAGRSGEGLCFCTLLGKDFVVQVDFPALKHGVYRFHDMPVQNSYPFYEGGYQGRPQVRGGRRGGLGERGYYRPQEEFPRHEA